MPLNAILSIGDDTYDILRCRYGFGRQVDPKGRPYGGMTGGEIIVELESTTDTALLERMLTGEPRPVAGSLEVWDEKESSLTRSVSWEEAYIYSASETMNGRSGLPMTCTLVISPLRLDIDQNISIDRRWPQTYGFWWQEHSPGDSSGIIASSEKGNILITDAYWIDENGTERREFYEGMSVTLYVVVENASAGESVPFAFDDGQGEVVYEEYTGMVDENGIMTIDNFTIQMKQQEGLDDE